MNETMKAEAPTTLTTLFQELGEIMEIISNTKTRLEVACDQELPETDSKDAPNPPVSLAGLERRVASIRRLANRTSSLTGELIG